MPKFEDLDAEHRASTASALVEILARDLLHVSTRLQGIRSEALALATVIPVRQDLDAKDAEQINFRAEVLFDDLASLAVGVALCMDSLASVVTAAVGGQALVDRRLSAGVVH